MTGDAEWYAHGQVASRGALVITLDSTTTAKAGMMSGVFGVYAYALCD